MKAILTSKKEVKNKAGKEFTIYSGLHEDGSTVTVFFDAEKNAEFPVPASVIVDKSAMAKLFRDLPVVDVEYNSQGRVAGVYIP